MTENKRFKMKKLEYEFYFIDSQQEYVDEDEPNFKIDGEKTMSDSQILDLLNKNEQLEKENLDLSEELDYYKTKCASLETGLFQADRENEQLKKVLGSILLEVKRDISNTNQTGEITVFFNPNSFNLISEVLRKYGH